MDDVTYCKVYDTNQFLMNKKWTDSWVTHTQTLCWKISLIVSNMNFITILTETRNILILQTMSA